MHTLYPNGIYLETSGVFQYKFVPVANDSVSFHVRAERDAHIALCTELMEAGPIVEVIIGCENDTKTVIRKNRTMRDRAVKKTAKLVRKNTNKEFTITWKDGIIACKMDKETIPFIAWTDPEPIRVCFIGVCTIGNKGMWSIESIQTDGKSNFQFFPAPIGISLNFQVKAESNVEIALSPEAKESELMYKVTLGSDKNTKSSIKKQDIHSECSTKDILKATEFREFWIEQTEASLRVGVHTDATAICTLRDSKPLPILYFGVRTNGVTGIWKLQAYRGQLQSVPPAIKTGTWTHSKNGIVPYGAMVGGQDNTGEPAYIARVEVGRYTIPGKLVSSTACTWIANHGHETSSKKYQVLVRGKYRWVPTSGSNIPPGALPGGLTAHGELLYICRVYHNNKLTIGWAQKSAGVCSVAIDGKEITFYRYEVLLY